MILFEFVVRRRDGNSAYNKMIYINIIFTKH